MKIEKQLLIGGRAYPLIQDEVRLELSTPGRAQFRVQASGSLSGAVEYFCGWGDGALTRYFVGYIERSNRVSDEEQLIFCRELAALLARPMPLGLRQASLRQVIREIGQQSGLELVTGRGAYSNTPSPYYFHTGSGYGALDALGTVYRVPDFIWQQQSDDRIFAGSWADSEHARTSLHLDDQALTAHLTGGGARLPMDPTLRPGVATNRGRIHAVCLSQELMNIQWKP